MSPASSHIVVVDGYSTGAFYLPLIKSCALRAVHVRSMASKGDGQFSEIADRVLDQVQHDYDVLLDEGPDLQDLAVQLSLWSPLAVLIGHESGVRLGERLAKLLALPGNDPTTTVIRIDKYAMHDALSCAGLSHLESLLTDGESELLEWAVKGGRLPVVLKPTSSTGADGVHVCRTEEEIRVAFGKLINVRTFFDDAIPKVLAQEFAPGTEVVVNTVSCQGRHRISDLWQYSKLITTDGRSVYDGAELVADFGDKTEGVLSYAMEVLDALGISFGPAHIEIMITPREPVLIECGARPMGGELPQSLLKEAVGHTQLELAMEAALEPEAFLSCLDAPYALRKHIFIKCLISTREGQLESIPALKLLKNLASVQSGNFLHKMQSSHVVRTVDLLSSPATLFLSHEYEEVVREDRQLITDIENDAEALLVELAPAKGLRPDPDWINQIPEGLWLKPEEMAAPEAHIIWQALELTPGQEVLDCPCGDGRVGIHLVRRGLRYTGVDINHRFIERARERFAAEGVEGSFHLRDMRDLEYVARFDAVVNWFNSFGYYDVETDFLILQRLTMALRPGGRLIVEAPNRSDFAANTVLKFDIEGTEVVKQWDLLAERVLYIMKKLEENGRIVQVVGGARLYSLSEYRLLFHLAGLKLEHVYDEALGEFTEHSRRMILIGRK